MTVYVSTVSVPMGFDDYQEDRYEDNDKMDDIDLILEEEKDDLDLKKTSLPVESTHTSTKDNPSSVSTEHPPLNSGINVHKFMLTIDVYPSGKVFPRIFPVGVTRKGMSRKKTVKKERKSKTTKEEII